MWPHAGPHTQGLLRRPSCSAWAAMRQVQQGHRWHAVMFTRRWETSGWGHVLGAQHAASSQLHRSRLGVFRPDVNDVDRLSRGEGARRRGTGCHNIPHRLNADERPLYEAAKKKGYLAVRGTGFRRERKVYRQWCDAKAMATVVIQQDWAGGGQDVIVVDLSTLRMTEVDVPRAEQACMAVAQRMGVAALPEPPDQNPHAVPFQIIPAPAFEAVQPDDLAYGAQVTGAAVEVATGEPDAPTAPASPLTARLLAYSDPVQRAAAADAAVQYLQAQADAAAREVRRLKEQEGWHNGADVVREAVAQMKGLRAQLEEARAAGELARMPRSARAAALFEAFDDDPEPPPSAPPPPPSTRLPPVRAAPLPAVAGAVACVLPDSDERHPRNTAAIWALPAHPLFFSADRALAKAFAKEAGAALTLDALTNA